MMQNILIPADFSECARFALDAGIELAGIFQSEIHLIHAIKAPDNLTESET